MDKQYYTMELAELAKHFPRKEWERESIYRRRLRLVKAHMQNMEYQREAMIPTRR